MHNKLIEKFLNKAGITPGNFESQNVDNHTFGMLAANLDNHGIDPYHLLSLYDESFDDSMDPGQETEWAPKWAYGSMDWSKFINAIENGRTSSVVPSKKLTVQEISKIVKEEMEKSSIKEQFDPEESEVEEQYSVWFLMPGKFYDDFEKIYTVMAVNEEDAEEKGYELLKKDVGMKMAASVMQSKAWRGGVNDEPEPTDQQMGF